MDVDPLASMRCWPIEVELAGRLFTIPALPAAEWWPIVASMDLMKVLNLIGEGEEIDDLLMAGELPQAELTTVLTEVVEETTGRSFYAGLVTVTAAEASWSWVGPRFALAGFRWDVAPIGAALDAALSILFEGLSQSEDKDAAKKFERLLENDPTRKADPVKMRTQFESIAGPPPTAGVRSTGEPSGSARPRTRTRPRPPRPDDPSAEPMTPLGRPARSARPANSAARPVAASPASGTRSRPPRG